MIDWTRIAASSARLAVAGSVIAAIGFVPLGNNAAANPFGFVQKLAPAVIPSLPSVPQLPGSGGGSVNIPVQINPSIGFGGVMGTGSVNGQVGHSNGR